MERAIRHSRHSPKGYLTLRDASKAVGVSVGTLRKWIQRKRIPGFRNPVSRLYFINKDNLDQLRVMAAPLPIVVNEDGLQPCGGDFPAEIPSPEDVLDPIKEPCDSATCLQELVINMSAEAKQFLGERVVEALFDIVSKE